MKGFKCFQWEATDHLQEEEGGGTKASVPGQSRLLQHGLNRCQRALLGIGYHQLGGPECFKGWPQKKKSGEEERGLICTKSALRFHKGAKPLGGNLRIFGVGFHRTLFFFLILKHIFLLLLKDKQQHLPPKKQSAVMSFMP